MNQHGWGCDVRTMRMHAQTHTHTLHTQTHIHTAPTQTTQKHISHTHTHTKPHATHTHTHTPHTHTHTHTHKHLPTHDAHTAHRRTGLVMLCCALVLKRCCVVLCSLCSSAQGTRAIVLAVVAQLHVWIVGGMRDAILVVIVATSTVPRTWIGCAWMCGT